MNLLLIESPNKVETIKKYLGKDYEVLATKGHIRDLPEKTLAVNVEHDFQPTYEIIPAKEALAKSLVSRAKKADNVYLATDPDREGEAISWHLCYILGIDPKDAKRITFNAITKDAINEGLKNPQPLNLNLVDAQQARRVLDRLIGYKLSPLISKKIRNKLSAGRVQSVALKILVMREKEIQNFKPEEYWNITAELNKQNAETTPFKAELFAKSHKKFLPANEQQATEASNAIRNNPITVSSVKKTVTTSNPPAPYITSTLQQDAGNRLKMSLKACTQSAQSLYEGVEIVGEGKTALVTYIRTDSTRIAPVAQNMAKDYITQNYGDKYVPAKPNTFKSKKSAQDAHEAIRPVSLKYTPEYLKGKMDNTLYKLYCMIFNRFVASQMVPAKYNSVAIEFNAGDYQLKSTGRTVLFDGYTRLFNNDEEKSSLLPEMNEGEEMKLINLTQEQKFTRPPARYTEASLVKELDEKGIGRPSTFAATVMTIAGRGYTEKKDNKYFVPTELGIQVVDYLDKYFPDLMNIKFTAEMENKLDEIEDGGKRWQDTIKDFYGNFVGELYSAYRTGDSAKKEVEVSNVKCEKCGAMMVYRESKFGKFLACPNYPKCKNTKSLETSTEPKQTPPDFKGICPKCGSVVSAKISKRGKVFFGCDNYPKCDFMSWDLPIAEKCPECKHPLYCKLNKDTLGTPHCINAVCPTNKHN